MENKGPSGPVENPYLSKYRLVRWIGTQHDAHSWLGPAIFNVAIFALGAALTLPESIRRSMLTFSTLSMAALVCFASHKYFGIGGGIMERLAAYPETIWLITFGLYVWRFHPKMNGTALA